ncbi:MAG: hypothetical protein L3J76_05990 [Candidatus Hydrothermae bacterium]|nr:hypothetical protein [Candidatus Hydrothermae bacterium]
MELDLKIIEHILGAELPPEARKDLATAWEFYRKYYRREPVKIRKVDLTPPRVVSEMGDLVALVYFRKEGRKVLPYIHVFQPPFPVLAASKDPDRLHILDGDFEVSEHGILH